MTLEEFVDRVDEYLDGVLPPEEAERVEALIRSDPACRAEYEEAQAFRELLGGRGREALQDVCARSLTEWVYRDAERSDERDEATSAAVLAEARAAQQDESPPARSRVWWWTGMGAAAAAVLVTLGLVVSPDPVPRTPNPDWVVGAVRTLAEGSVHELEGRARLFVARPSSVGLAADDVLDLHTGAANIRVPERERLEIRTPQGRIVAQGAEVYVAVDADSTSHVVVNDGGVGFVSDSGAAVRLVAGESVHVAPGGPVEFLSGSALASLRADFELQALSADALRGEVRGLREALAEARSGKDSEPGAAERPVRAPDQALTTDDVLDELPWTEFGRAARQLLRSRRSRGLFEDPVQSRALAVFLEHTAEIQALTGVQNPIDGILHPVVLERIAEPFFRTLAPHAPARDVRRAAAAARLAARRIGAELDSADPVPAERFAARLRVQRSVLLAAQDHLGVEVAVEVAAGLRGAGEIAPVRSRRIESEESLDDYAAQWGKWFDLHDNELLVVRALVGRLYEDVTEAQRAIEAELGAERARDILATGRWRHRFRGGPRHTDELPARERVQEAVETIEAKLRLAAAQVEFEQAMRELTGDAARERWTSNRWHLRSFDVR